MKYMEFDILAIGYWLLAFASERFTLRPRFSSVFYSGYGGELCAAGISSHRGR